MGDVKTQGHADAAAPSRPTSALDAWNAGITSVHAAPAAVVDPRIPGVAPDIAAIAPWVDTVPAKPTAASAKPATRHDQLVDMQATAHAAALTLTRHTTNDPAARWQFLNTLDRIDDPVLRAKTLEQFQAQTGMPLQVFINSTEWHSDRDQEQALALISPERGKAERELQGMSPEDRKKLTAKANGWSQQILQVTRATDADTDENAPKISNVLGERSPVEIEAIRASVRSNTRDKSLYQEIDRSLSGGNEDEALAGATGNPVFAASMGIANADGNAERIKEIVGGLSTAQRAGLVLSNGPLGASAITSAVHEGQRAEIQQLLTGSAEAANAAHFADLFKDPKAGLEMDGVELTQQSQQSSEARQPENVIRELRSKSPEDITKARIEWNKANPGHSWDQMIQERFGNGDPTMFLRINALAHGNKVEERAYALRDGIRKNNQAQIEAALANPDLTSTDAGKRAAAQAEKQHLEARVRELDALGLRATAMMTGQDPAQTAGRDLDAQLTDHYKDAVAKNPHTTDVAELLVLSADPEGSKAKRKVQAGEDTYATDELKTQGKLSTTTQIRRAETKGDTQRKAELLENLEKGSDLTKVRTEFQARYKKDPLAEPRLAEIDSAAAVLKSAGDSRPLSEIKASVANAMQTSNELRVEHVGRYGVKAERSEFLQHVLQKDLYAKQHSDSLEESEELRARYGLNVGTEDLVQSQLANQDEMFTKPAGPYGTGTRDLKDGVDREQFTQVDKNLTQSLDVQREEKLKHAERLATTFATIAKIGALLVAQPELFALIDIAAGLGSMAIKRSAGGSDVDLTTDTEMLAVTAIMDVVTLGMARFGGAGTAINAERAAQSAAHVGEKTAAELAEHGVTTEAKAEIVGAGARAAAGESRVLSKEMVAANGVEGSAAQLATKAETGSLAVAEGKLANEGVTAGETAVHHGRMVANVGVNTAGTVAGGIVQGETSDDLLLGVTRTLLGMFLPGRLAGSMQKAIGTGSKIQNTAGALLGAGANMGANYAISGDAIDAVGNGVQNHVGGHAKPHPGDDRYTPRRIRDDDPNPLAHYADHPDSAAAHGPEIQSTNRSDVHIRHDGQRTVVEIPAAATPHEAERMVAGKLAELEHSEARRARGEKPDAASDLGATGTGRDLSPEDMGRIAELRVAREQLTAGLDPAETERAAARIAHLEQSMGLHGESELATQRRRAVDVQVEMQLDAPRRAAMRAQLDGEHGHSRSEVHSHFMGVVKAEVFRQRAAAAVGGNDTGSWVPLLDKIASLPAAERDLNVKSGNPNAKSSFEHEKGPDGIEHRANAGDANQIVVDAKKQINVLQIRRAAAESDVERAAYTRAIEHVAAEAAQTALSATPETPFAGAYQIRDSLVRTTFGTDAERARGDHQAGFDDYIRETVLQLADDGVGYSEQSVGLGKIASETSPERIQAAIAQLERDGQIRPGQVDIKLLAMMKSAHLGSNDDRIPGPTRSQTPRTEHDKQSKQMIDQVENHGALGADYGGPEHNAFNAEGQQRYEDDYRAVLAAAARTGRPGVLRPHVGEGVVDTKQGKPFHTDKDRHIIGDEPSHYPRARENIDRLLDGLENLSSKGELDPSKVIVRFGHATHATPEQVKRMRDLGVIAEVNLGSNVATGSVSQTEGVHGQRTPNERLLDHALPSMLFYDAPVLLSTDGGAVMNTSLRQEYERAHAMIESVLSGAQPIRVRANDAVLDGQMRGKPSLTDPTQRELHISDLTAEERGRFTNGYEKLYRDAENYYLRRPAPGAQTADAPLGGRHHTNLASAHGLTSPTGTASFQGSRGDVDAALAAYEAAGYEVTRASADATVAVVTWSAMIDGKRVPQFTTTLMVDDRESTATKPEPQPKDPQ